MTKNSKIAGLLLSSVFAITNLISVTPVFAQSANPQDILVPGKCSSAATVQAALSELKQVPVVVGNRVTTRADRPANIFTSDSNGHGYLLEGDQPIGTPSNYVCVGTEYNQLHLNDINSPVVPQWALMGNNTNVANNNCRDTQSGLCESHDDYLQRASANGQRVMLAAQSIQKNDDGTYSNGRRLTVLTQVDTYLADVKATNSLGASESFGGLENVTYTKYSANFLQPKTTTVAALSPK